LAVTREVQLLFVTLSVAVLLNRHYQNRPTNRLNRPEIVGDSTF